MKIGQAVTFTDELGVKRPALLTTVHAGPDEPAPCVNLVTLSLDERKADSYGRQSEHFSSVIHKSKTTVHGRFYE